MASIIKRSFVFLNYAIFLIQVSYGIRKLCSSSFCGVPLLCLKAGFLVHDRKRLPHSGSSNWKNHTVAWKRHKFHCTHSTVKTSSNDSFSFKWYWKLVQLYPLLPSYHSISIKSREDRLVYSHCNWKLVST